MMKKQILTSIFFLCCLVGGKAQEVLPHKKLTYHGDFRFRVEQDWWSKKSDGTYRDDRTRLRYRLRFGLKYEHSDWASFGFGLRTGLPHKQQDPQLTLGDGLGGFGTLPFGVEKAYFKANHKGFKAWLGKNSFPFKKQDELFWSDNVMPEGVYLGYQFNFDSKYLNDLKLSTGHFILNTAGKGFDKDRYLQAVQMVTRHFDKRLVLYPGFYYFKNMPNVPDGLGDYDIDYRIFNFGGAVELFKQFTSKLSVDYFKNFSVLANHQSIPKHFVNEDQAVIASLSFGDLKQKGDWLLKFQYAYIERYAAVDFLAQNDWARWDYSSIGSPDGRLTNFYGGSFTLGYAIDKRFDVRLRYFIVEQLLPSEYNMFKETNSRIRLDLNIGF